MVPEARRVGCFPNICPNGKRIQSVSSPGCLTPNRSVGSGKCPVAAFLKCLGCSDVLDPLVFRAGAVPLSHRSPLWRDLAPFGFPGLQSICQPRWLEEITRRIQVLACPICCCPVFLTSARCPVCTLDLNRQLCIIKQVVGDIPEHGLADSSFKCRICMRRTAQAPFNAL